MNISNNPPYLSLDLEKEDAEWLVRNIAIAAAQADHDFFQTCNASGDSEIGQNRTLLSLAATSEQTNVKFIADKLKEDIEMNVLYDETFMKANAILSKRNVDYAEYVNRNG